VRSIERKAEKFGFLLVIKIALHALVSGENKIAQNFEARLRFAPMSR